MYTAITDRFGDPGTTSVSRQQLLQQVCVQPCTSAVNVTLLAFAAADRHAAAAPLLLTADACCRSVCWALSSKPAARYCCGRQTDGHPTVT